MQPIQAAGERQVAIYLRVSTDQQTVENQIPEIERLCAARGWTITHRYQETISGAARHRIAPLEWIRPFLSPSGCSVPVPP